MDFEDWLSIGREHGFISRPVCSTHEGIPMSDEEVAMWDEGDDTCIHILRLYQDNSQHDAVEKNMDRWH